MTTALGPVSLCRPYLWHPTHSGLFPADDFLGLDGFLTRQARRLVTLAGIDHSFARAQQVLAEFCGWEVDDEVIRRTTHAEARRVAEHRPERIDATAFAKAEGDVEVLIDAGKVNTLAGWRDVKVGLFLRRKAGEPATPDKWDQRRLPSPKVRTVIAAVEETGLFGERLRRESDRLKVTTQPALTVLGDGAEWIWNLASLHLPQASGVLDVFHAMEHLGTVAKAVWGEGTTAQADHLAKARLGLLERGKSGVDDWLGQAFAAASGEPAREVVRATAVYFAKHPTRLGYAERLASGRSIGSGAVEGSIKQLLNLRMKRTGARWRVDHVGPLVELRAFSQSQEWNHSWAAA